VEVPAKTVQLKTGIRKDGNTFMSGEKESHPLKQLRNLFITGLVVLVPIGATCLIVYKLFDLVDRNIRNLLQAHLEKVFGGDFPYPLYGVGVIITVLVILGTGVVARNLVGHKLITFMEVLMMRVPLVNRIYLAVKQISESLLQREKNLFQEVVLVEYPRRELYSLGFVTSEAPPVFENIHSECVCVFVSTTPNPTSGVLVVVPRKDVIPLNISVEDGMKMVISGGVVIPENLFKSDKAIKDSMDTLPSGRLPEKTSQAHPITSPLTPSE
jgi:uncharacterized membrane protein